MPDSDDERRAPDAFLDGVNARLDDAARRGAPLELILAVRGRVAPVAGKNGRRWRLRTGRGHVVTFRPEFVVAFNQTTRARHSKEPTSPAGADRRPHP